jgi:fluoroquinolone resistance protein
MADVQSKDAKLLSIVLLSQRYKVASIWENFMKKIEKEASIGKWVSNALADRPSREMIKKRKMLRNTDLSNADLSGLTLQGKDFQDAEFFKANLSNTTFTKCVFKGANLAWVTLDGCRFIDCDFTGASLRFSKGSDIVFSKCSLVKTDMKSGSFSKVQFSSSDLIGVDFEGTTFLALSLEGTTLRATSLVANRALFKDSTVSIRKISNLKELQSERSDLTFEGALRLSGSFVKQGSLNLKVGNLGFFGVTLSGVEAEIKTEKWSGTSTVVKGGDFSVSSKKTTLDTLTLEGVRSKTKEIELADGKLKLNIKSSNLPLELRDLDLTGSKWVDSNIEGSLSNINMRDMSLAGTSVGPSLVLGVVLDSRSLSEAEELLSKGIQDIGFAPIVLMQKSTQDAFEEASSSLSEKSWWEKRIGDPKDYFKSYRDFVSLLDIGRKYRDQASISSFVDVRRPLIRSSALYKMVTKKHPDPTYFMERLNYLAAIWKNSSEFYDKERGDAIFADVAYLFFLEEEENFRYGTTV